MRPGIAGPEVGKAFLDGAVIAGEVKQLDHLVVVTDYGHLPTSTQHFLGEKDSCATKGGQQRLDARAILDDDNHRKRRSIHFDSLQRLFHAVIEDTEILFVKPHYQLAFGITYHHGDTHQTHISSNRGLVWRLTIFLAEYYDFPPQEHPCLITSSPIQKPHSRVRSPPSLRYECEHVDH